MKKILIDDLVAENTDGGSCAEFRVDVDGNTFSGYKIAKPLNYDPEYSTKKERKEMAQLVLDGKAIAVSFFEDLTPEEQSEHVKKMLDEE